MHQRSSADYINRSRDQHMSTVSSASADLSGEDGGAAVAVEEQCRLPEEPTGQHLRHLPTHNMPDTVAFSAAIPSWVPVI
jgi:hypothetical protein